MGEYETEEAYESTEEYEYQQAYTTTVPRTEYRTTTTLEKVAVDGKEAYTVDEEYTTVERVAYTDTIEYTVRVPVKTTKQIPYTVTVAEPYEYAETVVTQETYVEEVQVEYKVPVTKTIRTGEKQLHTRDKVIQVEETYYVDVEVPYEVTTNEKHHFTHSHVTGHSHHGTDGSDTREDYGNLASNRNFGLGGYLRRYTSNFSNGYGY